MIKMTVQGDGGMGDGGMDVAMLSELAFFRGESPRNLDWLREVVGVRRLVAQEVLLAAREPNDCLYVVVEGSFRVELEAKPGEAFCRIGRGECIGEVSVLDGRPVTTTVRAEQPSQVVQIPQQELWELIARSQMVARNLLRLLAQRIRKDDEVLSESLTLQQKYAHTARIDNLTGLYNRHWLAEMLPRLVERAHNDGEPLGMLMLDVDNFKRYNDSWGHQAGDEVLRTVGTILLGHIRADDSAVRYGGEEFVMILPGLTARQVQEIAERLCHAVGTESEQMLREQGLPGVHLSIGVAMLDDGQQGEALLAIADRALYQAKHGGRNRVVVG